MPLRTNIWLSFSEADLGPTCAQFFFFLRLFYSLELFFVKMCAHSERYRKLMAGIFKIDIFFGNIVFPLSSV